MSRLNKKNTREAIIAQIKEVNKDPELFVVTKISATKPLYKLIEELELEPVTEEDLKDE